MRWNHAVMILGRIISNSSFDSSSFAIASHSFLVKPRFNFDNLTHQTRHFSAYPRFDFDCIREPSDAIDLFREMMRTRPLPSVFLFSKLFSTVVKMRQYSVALHLFDEMLERDAPVNHYTLSIAIDCYCRLKRPDFGFAILGSFFKRGYEPNVVTFNTLIKGLLLVGKIPEAAKLFIKLLDEHLCKPSKRNEVCPDLFTFNIFLDASCREGRVEEAEHFLAIMKQYDVQPDIFSYNALINGYCLRREMEKATNIFQLAVKSGIKPDIVSYSSLMNGYCKMGLVDEVSRLFTEIPAKGLKRDLVSYNIMLDALFRDGRCEEGLNLFKGMETLQDVQRDIRTYNILLDGLCSAHRIDEAPSVLHAMEDKGIIPDIVTYNILIDGLCSDDKLTQAKDLFDELPSTGMQPNVVTYNTLIGAVCGQGRVEEAKDLMIQMVNNGCLPNIVTYNVFVGGLLKMNKACDLIPLLEEMNARGFTIGATTLSLIEPLQRKGRDSVLFDIVKKLVPKDIQANVVG